MERDYLPLYDAYGLGLTTWSPLASGVLTGKYSKTSIPPGSRLALPNYKVRGWGEENWRGEGVGDGWIGTDLWTSSHGQGEAATMGGARHGFPRGTHDRNAPHMHSRNPSSYHNDHSLISPHSLGALSSPFPPPLQNLANRKLVDEVLDRVEELRPIARELECTLAQLALAWAAKNPHVSSVITGATREEQVRGEKEGVQPL